MRDIRFYAAAVILMAVMTLWGYSSLHSAEGIMLSKAVEKAASENSSLIKGITLEKYDKEVIELKGEKSKLTADLIDSIVIDGNEYAFPIRIGDLSDDFTFSVSISDYADSSNNKKYAAVASMMYKGQSIATAFAQNDVNEFNDDAVITGLNFPDETNEYMPQIIIGGMDVYNSDLREMNRIYGIDSDIYGYLSFIAECDTGTYKLEHDYNSDCISKYRYMDNSESGDDYMPVVTFYDGYNTMITLPEDYSLETDELNNSMEYMELPENNEEMKAALDNLTIEDVHIQLPCTVNALMYQLGADEAMLNDYDPEISEYGGVIEYSASFSSVDFSALLEPGQQLGEARVYRISSHYLDFDNISLVESDDPSDGMDIVHDDVYSFTEYDIDDILINSYYLTDYKNNNVFYERSIYILSYESEIRYWPENLESMW